MQLASDAPIKRRSIDDDPKPGFTTISLSYQTIEEPVNFSKMTQNLRDPNYRELLGIDDRVAAGGAHPRPANAKKFHARVAAAQGFDELGSVHFTRSLARGDQDLHEINCIGRDSRIDGCSLIGRRFHLVVGVRRYLRRVRPRSWYFLVLVLQLIKLVVDPALREKLLVRAHFSDLSLVHHNDLVRSLHR